MVKRKKLLAFALALPLALTACGGDDEGGGGGNGAAAGAGKDIKIAVVTHGNVGDAFWDVVKKGSETAGKDLGIDVSYQADGDPQKQSQLIDNAVADKVDGLVVSMANPPALKSSIEKAVSAGIPVITINSGVDQFKEYGALTHVGQTETVAGEGAGEKLREAGVTKLLCIVQEAGNVGLEQRCDGARKTLAGEVENLQVDGTNLEGSKATIQGKLSSDKSFDGVLALGPGPATAARDAIAAAGSDAQLANFDLNADVVKAIQDGDILFAVDQQQYEQGYLPVVFLYLYKTNLNTVGGGLPVLTGPGFVTKENAAEVEDLAADGTR
ncbi:MAG: sugar ABC transporter substrate-binding protein [Pseudonocardiaceae bacterium]